MPHKLFSFMKQSGVGLHLLDTELHAIHGVSLIGNLVENALNNIMIHTRNIALALLALFSYCALPAMTAAASLKLHAVFADHMVLQRDQPIKIWGWAEPGQTVYVKFGEETAEAEAAAAAPVEVFGHEEEYAGLGRWEVSFPAREANAEPTTLHVTDKDVMLEVEDILIGDVWVLYGQSNMAFPYGSKVYHRHMEMAQADLPKLRMFSIKGNEQQTLQDDIRPETIETEGWVASTPETAREFSAIGHVFGSRMQRALQIPVGLIKNARGGASIESMVPAHKFDENPLTKRYADYIRQRMDEFDWEAAAERAWERAKAKAKRKGNPEPPRQDPKDLRSWNVPGKSPSDMASIYNGMFGVFKGYNIKVVLFHQGYNNATSKNCNPKRYRVLTRLMIEGIREDFNAPDLAFGIIGLCAGGNAQNEDNFERESIDPGAYIREAQRLGLADVENQNNLVFLPAYDVRSPGLHPPKKREHGQRAAHWAIARVYPGPYGNWREVELLSAEPKGDHIELKFSGSIIDDNRSSIPRGFSIAGEDGKFYKAHARYAADKGHPSGVPNVIRVWSPLVEEPVAVRYAWARAPMGNLKQRGHPDRPFPSFRTDDWDWPESEDPAESLIGGGEWNQIKAEAAERLEFRRTEEAKRGVEILERIKKLKAPSEDDEK
jgi:sialate O-acetylesterase